MSENKENKALLLETERAELLKKDIIKLSRKTKRYK